MTDFRKPAAWSALTLDDLFACEAGQAYIVRQFGGDVCTEFSAKSSRTNCDSAEYEVFADGSLLFTNNAEDVVATDASDWANENLTGFNGMRWTEETDADGFVIDDMDRNLMIHLWGEEAAAEHFERCGGVLPPRTTDVTAQEFVDGQESLIVFYVSAAHATGTDVALLADTQLPFELSDIVGTVADGRWTWNGEGEVFDELANNVQTIHVYSDRAEWLRQIVDYATSDGDREGVAEYLKRSGLTDDEIEEHVGEWLRTKD